MLISADVAKALADEMIAKLGAESGLQLVLLDDCHETEKGWVFFYNSEEYVRTADFRTALAGNGPLFVSRFGTVATLPSAIPWEEAVLSL